MPSATHYDALEAFAISKPLLNFYTYFQTHDFQHMAKP